MLRVRWDLEATSRMPGGALSVGGAQRARDAVRQLLPARRPPGDRRRRPIPVAGMASDAHLGPPVDAQADHHRVAVVAGDEVAGAVDGIDHPDPAVAAGGRRRRAAPRTGWRRRGRPRAGRRTISSLAAWSAAVTGSSPGLRSTVDARPPRTAHQGRRLQGDPLRPPRARARSVMPAPPARSRVRVLAAQQQDQPGHGTSSSPVTSTGSRKPTRSAASADEGGREGVAEQVDGHRVQGEAARAQLGRQDVGHRGVERPGVEEQQQQGHEHRRPEDSRVGWPGRPAG